MSLPEIATAEVVAHSSDRETWLAARKDSIGASEVAVVLGLIGSPTELYARKLGLLEDIEGNERMRWGLRLEGAILAGVADERGYGELAVPDGRLLRSREHPNLSATPDGWLTNGAEALLTEVKNTAAWTELPAHIWVQAQAQMLVTGQERALVASLQFGSRFVPFEIERDNGFLVDMVGACDEFWYRVQHQEIPDPDGSEACKRALAAMFPQDDGGTIELPVELVEALEERERLKAEAKDIEARIGATENTLRASLASASCGTVGGWKATYKSQSRKASTCPNCQHVITPASTYRVLRVTAPKG